MIQRLEITCWWQSCMHTHNIELIIVQTYMKHYCFLKKSVRKEAKKKTKKKHHICSDSVLLFLLLNSNITQQCL